MPQSLVKNYLHITFSTKYRLPIITEDVKRELFQYIGGICKKNIILSTNKIFDLTKALPGDYQ